jgi:hypothetical protein
MIVVCLFVVAKLADVKTERHRRVLARDHHFGVEVQPRVSVDGLAGVELLEAHNPGFTLFQIDLRNGMFAGNI